MALEFNCSACGAVIAVKYLRAGDEAHCKSCGKFTTVPPQKTECSDVRSAVYLPSALALECDTVRIPVGFPCRRAWNPLGIAWLALFFPESGWLMHAYNFERLGDPDRKERQIRRVWAAIPAYWLGTLTGLLSSSPAWALSSLLLWNFGLRIVGAVYICKSQCDLFDRFIGSGRARKGFGIPVLASLGYVYVLQFLAGLIIGIATHDAGGSQEANDTMDVQFAHFTERPDIRADFSLPSDHR